MGALESEHFRFRAAFSDPTALTFAAESREEG
jgi:hypothetical protein